MNDGLKDLTPNDLKTFIGFDPKFELVSEDLIFKYLNILGKCNLHYTPNILDGRKTYACRWFEVIERVKISHLNHIGRVIDFFLRELILYLILLF